MLNIAVCDDEVPELSNMISIINEYKETNIFRYEITYTAFQSAVELIAAIESGNRYSIILLDIVMPRITGMEAAKEIRTHDKVAKIIFLTSSPDFAVESYAVDAFYYALKPVWKDKLFAVLDKVLAEMQEQNEPSILVKSKTGLTRIPLHMLEYAEIAGRTIFYHLVNGIVLEETSVMAKLEQVLLAYPQFAKPHRAFIVNLDCIDVFALREVKLYSHAEIPIAKANHTELKASYIARVFQRSGEKSMLLAINYLAVLIYGVLIMALLLDIKINRKDILILSVYVVLSGLLQLVLFSAYGEEFIEKTYPLVIHLPLFLLFVWFYKKRFVSVLFVLFTAYFLTTPRKLIGDLVSSFFNHDPSLSIVVQLIASVLLLLVIYRYLRPFVIQILEHKGAQTILLTVMPALYYFLAYATVYTDTLYRSSVLVIGMLGVILNFCFYLFLIIYFNEMTKSFAAQTEQTILQLEIDATVTQIEDYKASQMQAAIYRHDLRHHLYYLSTLIAEHHIEESLDYITRINSDVEAAQVVQYCENMPVNLILSSYAAQSKNNNIAIEIHAIVPTEIPIKSTDICVILANGIENAIHACMKIEDVGCRKLTVMCMFENKKLKIAICNPFLGEIRFEKDIPLSEESNHGFGVKSIVAAVQKYQGVYSFAAENGIFAMRVILQ